MSETDAAVLGTSDASGCWAWAGARLSAEGRVDATQRYPDLTWDERRERLTEEEAAWLAAQWDPPRPGSRFEVRFATGPDAKKVRAALLVRVLAPTPGLARNLARERLLRAAGHHGAMPPHVGAGSIDDEAELRTWLEYPGRLGSIVELRKHLSVGRVVRGGATLPYAVCHGYFDSGAAWDAWWRKFADVEVPAVLTVGFETYDAGSGPFRRQLRQRAQELEGLAVAGVPSPLNPNPVPPEPAARSALPGYRRALMRYAGRCFRIRVTLASAEPLPPTLIESLVRTVSNVEGAVHPVSLVDGDYDDAVREHRSLGAVWPTLPFDALDQLLHSLADVGESASVLSLPVHWPGMPPVFDAIGSELRPERG